MACNTSVQNYILKKIDNMNLRKCNVFSEPSVTEQRCVNTVLEVTLRFCHLHLHQVNLSVRDRNLAWVTSNHSTLDASKTSTTPSKST